MSLSDGFCTACRAPTCFWTQADGARAPPALRGAVRRMVREPGQILFREGEPAADVYVVCSGLVSLGAGFAGGKTQTLELVGPGELLGEAEALLAGEHRLSARVIEGTCLSVIERQAFVQVSTSHPVWALRLLRKLAQDVTSYAAHLVEASYASSEAKVCRLLVTVAHRFGSPVPGGTALPPSLSRTHLASMAGISTDKCIRILSSLKGRGFLAISRRAIVVLDLPALSALRYHTDADGRAPDPWPGGPLPAPPRQLSTSTSN